MTVRRPHAGRAARDPTDRLRLRWGDGGAFAAADIENIPSHRAILSRFGDLLK